MNENTENIFFIVHFIPISFENIRPFDNYQTLVHLTEQEVCLVQNGPFSEMR